MATFADDRVLATKAAVKILRAIDRGTLGQGTTVNLSSTRVGVALVSRTGRRSGGEPYVHVPDLDWMRRQFPGGRDRTRWHSHRTPGRRGVTTDTAEYLADLRESTGRYDGAPYVLVTYSVLHEHPAYVATTEETYRGTELPVWRCRTCNERLTLTAARSRGLAPAKGGGLMPERCTSCDRPINPATGECGCSD